MKRRRQSQGGILPFLDLLFILLFSLLALSDTKKSSSQEPVRIRLPKVEPGESDQPEENRATVVLEIDGESRIRLQGVDEIVNSPEELDELLVAFLDSRLPEECQVEIHGDTKADHGVSVGLLQHLRRMGFSSVSLLATGEASGSWTKGDDR